MSKNHKLKADTKLDVYSFSTTMLAFNKKRRFKEFSYQMEFTGILPEKPGGFKNIHNMNTGDVIILTCPLN
ncbi:hypothetical protein CW304_27630 [Bacillus sp. UFRGS-B20]|nr:hypothetical protein CW304_27630 [Bacillus sp. UFRGS-B20]